MSFINKPQDAGRLMAENKIKSDELKNSIRFFDIATPGDSAEVVFLDGVMGDDGFLMCPTVHLHKNFEEKLPVYYACTNFKHNECPLCESDIPVSFYGLFTVFVKSGVKNKKGEIKGVNTRQVFAVKQSVLQTLNKLAGPRGGIKGWKCGITRKDERSARTGDLFDFIKDIRPDGFAIIEKAFPGFTQPLDYDKAIIQLEPDKLREKGFGVKKTSLPQVDHDVEALKNDLSELNIDLDKLDI